MYILYIYIIADSDSLVKRRILRKSRVDPTTAPTVQHKRRPSFSRSRRRN